MPKFKEYLPNFFSGFNTISFKFDTFDELEEKLKKKLNFPPEGFEMCCGNERTLMGISKSDREVFFVRGFVENFDLTKHLKIYKEMGK